MEETRPISRHPRRSKKAAAAAAAVAGGGGGAAAKSAYDDVFGGPPRFAVPFSGRPDDYSEIFGGVASSCSIPFLDLPPAIGGGGAESGGGGVDYGEIFGCGAVDFGDFAVPYEELFGESNREEIASSNGRASSKNELGQQDTESFVFHPEYPSGDNLPYLEEDRLSSHSYHSDEGVNQLKISYNKRSQGHTQDSIAITTHAVDSLHNTQPHNPPNISNGSMIHGKCDSSDSTKSTGSDKKGDQKQNGAANLKQHKRSSSNHSTSSGDVLSPDAAFLSVTDINLRTQPLKVPPPSRPPPKLLNNTEQPKLKRDAYSVKLLPKASTGGAFSKSHSLPLKVDSPYFFDVEVDASSAAAASAAAMKEAMEFAQAKLKSAKELMERKRDNFENRKKKGHSGDIKSRENKESQTAEEEEIFKEVLSLKKKVKEDKKMGDFSFVGKNEGIGNKESHVLSTDRSQRTMQRSASGPSQFSKLENSGNWKLDDQFYELTNNKPKPKHNTDTEVSQLEDNANKEKADTEIKKDEESNSVTAEICHEIEKNINSGLEGKEIPKAVSEAYGQAENVEVRKQVKNTQGEQDMKLEMDWEKHESEKKVEKLHASEKAHDQLEEIKEMPNAISKTCVYAENVNKLEKLNDSCFVDSAILGTAQEAHHKNEDEKEPCEGEIPPTCEVFEKTLEASEFIHLSLEDTSEMEVPQETCEGEESHKKLNISENMSLQNEKDEVIELCGGSEAAEKTERAQKAECSHEERDVKLENPNLAQKKEETEVLIVAETTCDSTANKLIAELNPKADEMEAEVKFNKTEQELVGPGETENDMKETIRAFACNISQKEASEVLPENKLGGNDHQAAKVPPKEEKYNLKEAKEVLEEDNATLDLKDESTTSDSAINVSMMAVNEDLEDQKTNCLEMRGNKVCSLQDAESSCTLTFEKTTSVVRNKDEREKERAGEKENEQEKETERFVDKEREREIEREREHEKEMEQLVEKERERKIEREREQEKERARKLEEERERRERERERERDKERARKLEEEREREKEREREQEKERARKSEEERESEREFERARKLEEEREREREFEREQEKERARKFEEEREKERERERKIEREREQEKERMRKLEEEQERERERERKIEREREQEKERARKLEEEREREREREREQEKERARKLEEERERERERERKIEREREQEKERERLVEKERERKIEREREQEKERERKLEEEREREREREKDRLAVERATREAHERAFSAARQRAASEAREKAERLNAEALERSLSEKVTREARLRAERAAVERATAEARERAIEKAMAGKAAADARERMERFSSSFKEHKTSNQDMSRDAPFQRAYSSNYEKSSDSNNQGEPESALRRKARLERHQRTVERAAKALAEKNMRDLLAQREQAERNRLAEFLDADVKRWSNGKEGNLRALLSTLQYILGPDSCWQPIPLTDVITAAAVKKAYRKATLYVHPDKVQQRGASIQQKYICEKVFDLLKEAWNRFNSEER